MMDKYCRLCGDKIEVWEGSIDGMHEQCYTQVESKIESRLMDDTKGDIAVIIDGRRERNGR